MGLPFVKLTTYFPSVSPLLLPVVSALLPSIASPPSKCLAQSLSLSLTYYFLFLLPKGSENGNSEMARLETRKPKVSQSESVFVSLALS